MIVPPPSSPPALRVRRGPNTIQALQLTALLSYLSPPEENEPITSRPVDPSTTSRGPKKHPTTQRQRQHNHAPPTANQIKSNRITLTPLTGPSLANTIPRSLPQDQEHIQIYLSTPRALLSKAFHSSVPSCLPVATSVRHHDIRTHLTLHPSCLPVTTSVRHHDIHIHFYLIFIAPSYLTRTKQQLPSSCYLNSMIH